MFCVRVPAVSERCPREADVTGGVLAPGLAYDSSIWPALEVRRQSLTSEYLLLDVRTRQGCIQPACVTTEQGPHHRDDGTVAKAGGAHPCFLTHHRLRCRQGLDRVGRDDVDEPLSWSCTCSHLDKREMRLGSQQLLTGIKVGRRRADDGRPWSSWNSLTTVCLSEMVHVVGFFFVTMDMCAVTHEHPRARRCTIHPRILTTTLTQNTSNHVNSEHIWISLAIVCFVFCVSVNAPTPLFGVFRHGRSHFNNFPGSTVFLVPDVSILCCRDVFSNVSSRRARAKSREPVGVRGFFWPLRLSSQRYPALLTCLQRCRRCRSGVRSLCQRVSVVLFSVSPCCCEFFSCVVCCFLPIVFSKWFLHFGASLFRVLLSFCWQVPLLLLLFVSASGGQSIGQLTVNVVLVRFFWCCWSVASFMSMLSLAPNCSSDARPCLVFLFGSRRTVAPCSLLLAPPLCRPPPPPEPLETLGASRLDVLLCFISHCTTAFFVTAASVALLCC